MSTNLSLGAKIASKDEATYIEDVAPTTEKLIFRKDHDCGQSDCFKDILSESDFSSNMSPRSTEGTTVTKPPSYSEARLRDAAIAVILGRLTFNTASRVYRIPRSVLERQMSLERSQDLSLSTTPVDGSRIGNDDVPGETPDGPFTAAQEQLIVAHIRRLRRPVTVGELRRFAYLTAEGNGLAHSFCHRLGKAGMAWLKGFLRRHPALAPAQAKDSVSSQLQVKEPDPGSLFPHFSTDALKEASTILLEHNYSTKSLVSAHLGIKEEPDLEDVIRAEQDRSSELFADNGGCAVKTEPVTVKTEPREEPSSDFAFANCEMPEMPDFGWPDDGRFGCAESDGSDWPTAPISETDPLSLEPKAEPGSDTESASEAEPCPDIKPSLWVEKQRPTDSQDSRERLAVGEVSDVTTEEIPPNDTGGGRAVRRSTRRRPIPPQTLGSRRKKQRAKPAVDDLPPPAAVVKLGKVGEAA